MRTKTLLVSFVCLAVIAGCDDPSSCHVGYWKGYVAPLSVCYQCNQEAYLHLTGNGQLYLLHDNVVCDTGQIRFFYSGIEEHETYRVNGSTLVWHPEWDSPVLATINCQDDHMQISGLGSAEGAGSWTRLTGGELEEVSDIMSSSCPVTYGRCFGDLFFADQCYDDDDCPQFSGLDNTDICQDGTCYMTGDCW